MKLYIKQKLWSWKDKFTVKDEYGEDRYTVEGEFFSLGRKLHVCDMAGRELNPEGGCKLAFNLDGGNSTAMLFKQLDAKSGKLKYVKVNCPEIERFLSDIIYFATLVK